MKAFSLMFTVLCFSISAVTCSPGVKMPSDASQEQLRATVIDSKNKEAYDTSSIVQWLSNNRITGFYPWEVDNKTMLFCLVQSTGKPEFPGEPPVSTLSIVDKQGQLVYKLDDVEIRSMSTAAMLRLPSSQLVVAVNWGGKVNSLKILNYQNGKIMELLEEGDQDYSISALVKPQFRDGVNPSEEPYEILLMRGVGLPSPDEKQVSVYRYAGGYYEFKGEFSQKLLDNYMEQLLRKKAR